jgi:hypothetical protein
MSTTPELLVVATALLSRAQRLVGARVRPSVRPSVLAEITAIALTVRDAHVELREMLLTDREGRLSSVADVLSAEAIKLEAIERRIDIGDPIGGSDAHG